MSAPLVLALDLSLTSTGVADTDGHPHTWRSTARGVERLSQFADRITETIDAQTPHLIVIEGYAFGRHNQAAHLGELGGVVRLAIHDRGCPFIELPPASVKKYATGKGNAGKEEMLAEAIRRLAYTGHSNDEADALWLRAMALDGLGHPVVTMPAEHRKALAKVPWPSLEVPAE